MPNMGEFFKEVVSLAKEAPERLKTDFEENLNVNRTSVVKGDENHWDNLQHKDHWMRGESGTQEQTPRGVIGRSLISYHDSLLGQTESTASKVLGYGVPGLATAGLAYGSNNERKNGNTLGAGVLGAGAAVMGGALAYAGFGRVAEANISRIASSVVKDSQITGEKIAANEPRAAQAAQEVATGSQVAPMPQAHPEAVPTPQVESMPAAHTAVSDEVKEAPVWPPPPLDISVSPGVKRRYTGEQSVFEQRIKDADRLNQSPIEDHHKLYDSFFSSQRAGHDMNQLKQNIDNVVKDHIENNSHIQGSEEAIQLYMSAMHRQGYTPIVAPNPIGEQQEPLMISALERTRS